MSTTIPILDKILYYINNSTATNKTFLYSYTDGTFTKWDSVEIPAPTKTDLDNITQTMIDTYNKKQTLFNPSSILALLKYSLKKDLKQSIHTKKTFIDVIVYENPGLDPDLITMLLQ